MFDNCVEFPDFPAPVASRDRALGACQSADRGAGGISARPDSAQAPTGAFRWPTELGHGQDSLASRRVDASEFVSPDYRQSQLRSLRALWCSVVAFAIFERDDDCVLSPYWLVLCRRAGLDPEQAIKARMRYLDGLLTKVPRVIAPVDRMPYASQEAA